MLSLTILSVLAGCETLGCLGGEEGCQVPSPCGDAIVYSCEGGTSSASILQVGDSFPGGMDTLASPGDYVLSNDRVTAVIDALDHPHYLAPTGGSLLDLTTVGADNDSLRNVFQVVGLLPNEAAHYTRAELIRDGDVQGVQFVGTLDGRPDTTIATRYEIRPCEPGIRVRTEIYNGEEDPQTWYPADAWYYGGRETLPFTPAPGTGFSQPAWGLTDVPDAVRSTPFAVIAGHAEPAASYAVLSCNDEELTGFHSPDVSGIGPERRIVMPRDYAIYERFIAAAEGPAVSVASDLALELMSQLDGSTWTTLSGQVTAEGAVGTFDNPARATVLVSEGTLATPVEERVPWTEARPAADGTFTVRVPTDRPYVLEVEAFGDIVATVETAVEIAPVDIGTIEVDPAGLLTINATVDGEEDHVLVLFYPSDASSPEAEPRQFHDNFWSCAPLLGNPNDASPACNRALITGPTEVLVPPGTWDIYANGGPFTTVARVQDVEVLAGSSQGVQLDLLTLDLQPAGTLNADFHVHGSASFDSSLGDTDRVRAWLAARIDVIAITEHDSNNDYAQAMSDLDAYDRLVAMPGTESTGHILWNIREDYDFPQVIGHWNFWPIPFDESAPYRGSAWDELAEPGTLMQRHSLIGWDPETAVAQMNHPWYAALSGRDLGWFSAMGVDFSQDLPTTYDGTGQSLIRRTPAGTDFANSDFHATEVMNGSDNHVFVQNRALWHYLLNQGLPKAGTANSDSHTIGGEVMGVPRTLVYTDTTVADFDDVAFNAAVRDGAMLGTNGPVLEAWIEDGADLLRPSVTPIAPSDSATLHVSVRAAPWVPVEELRVVVNGQVVETVTDLVTPADPLGVDDLDRLQTSFPLSTLLSGSGDAWITVEAGTALPANADLDCNGMPDTGDNNGDGTIDWRDVAGLEEAPEDTTCLEDIGPLAEPAIPSDREDPLHLFGAVVPGGAPNAFTNAFVLDRDGGGFGGVQ